MLEVDGLSKRFGGVAALDNVSFRAAPGRIHALLGENGAGKSTLLKCLSGVHRPDAGAMRLGGSAFRPRNPRAAECAGLRFVHQELNLVPALTGFENAFVGRPYPRRPGWPGRFGLVDWNFMRAQVLDVCARCGLDADVDQPVRRLSVAKRQIVEILKALLGEARVLVLDEPTASLSEDEAAVLHAVMRRLAALGCAVVFVSHRLDEVLGVADDYSVLRNGRVVGGGRIGETNRAALVTLMAGQAERTSRTAEPAALGAPLLELAGFWTAPSRPAVALSVRAGELVGIYGVVGSGRSSLLKAMWGALPGAGGGMTVGGRALPPTGIAARLAAGAAFVPEDRRHAGLVMAHSVLDNAALPNLGRLRRAAGLPVLSWRRARNAVGGMLARLAVKHRRLSDPVGSLSGGNQQKVMIGRWLERNPRLFLLDEPTRGVDVRAKAEIHDLCRALAASGAAVVFASSDLEELLALSTRVLVMASGAIALDVPVDRASRRLVVEAAARAGPRQNIGAAG